MRILQSWTILLLLLLILVTACNLNSIDTPTSISVDITQTQAMTATTELMTATSTIFATQRPTATSTATISPSSTPTPTESLMEEAKQTLTPTLDVLISEPVWANRITETLRFEGTNLNWSPSANQFAYSLLTDDLRSYIYLSHVEDFQPEDITPTTLGRYVNVLWHPSGNYFYIESTLADDPYDKPVGWKAIISDSGLEELEPSGTYDWGWLNDNLVISESRVGTGMFSISIVDTNTDEGIASTTFDGTIIDVTEDYVVLYDDMWASVAMLSQEVISPEYQGFQEGTHVNYLSDVWYESTPERSFRSAFADVLPDSNQLLVTTWAEGQYPTIDAIFSGNVKTDLQLWDLANDEISMLIPGGIFGRFSNDGQLLFSIVVNDSQLVATLMNLQSDIDIFKMPVSLEFSNSTFSPDSRFISFFTPLQLDLDENGQVINSQATEESYFTIYDVAWGQFLPQIPLKPQIPIWSPTSDKLVLQHNDAYYLLSVSDFEYFTISDTSTDRLFNPQWSHDGRYLSFEYCGLRCLREIFILETP